MHNNSFIHSNKNKLDFSNIINNAEENIFPIHHMYINTLLAYTNSTSLLIVILISILLSGIATPPAGMSTTNKPHPYLHLTLNYFLVCAKLVVQ